MGAPIGLSNFTSAFLQGYQGMKDKQTQDARQQAQDDMTRQQFDLQQQARQLDINNAIKAGQEHDQDRAVTLATQQRQKMIDDSKRNVIGAHAQGDMHGALSGIEDYISKDPNAPGKLTFQRDAGGNIAIDATGKATGNYVDGAGRVVRTVNETPEKIVAGFNARVDPDSYLKSQSDIAKDARKQQGELAVAQAKANNDLRTEQYKQSQANIRDASDNRTKMDIARLDGSDDTPGSALALQRLQDVYPHIKNTDNANNMLVTLRKNPGMFVNDYIDSRKADAFKNGRTALPSDVMQWAMQANDIAQQLGLMPSLGQAQPSPSAPPAFRMPAPQPQIPAVSTSAGRQGQNAITNTQRQGIVKNLWGDQ